MHFKTIALPIVAVGMLLAPHIANAAPADEYSATKATPGSSYGYTITNYDQDILFARQSLDRFWGDPYMTPGQDNKWYTAPGFSWLNELGGTHTGCGDLETVDANRKAFFYCYRDKVIYVDYSQLRALHAEWGYDGMLAMLAHEWGHHIQNLLGISQPQEYQQEQQADCFSGTALRWMHTGLPRLDRTELGSLAYSTGGEATHGSSAMRQYWWQFGWDNMGSPASYQFACMGASY